MDKYIIALLKCKGIGNVKLLNYILKYNKNIDDILKNLEELLNPKDLQIFDIYLREAENEIMQNKNNKIRIISVMDGNYPVKLLTIKDPILYFYYIGDISLITNTTIAIIGSRNINDNEKKITEELSKKVSNKGITVVSGLALGTDTYAHLGSYNEKGKTIAVLASGLNIINPSSNKSLAKNIIKSGGLIISEYSIDTSPTKYTFVKRDRIQAALSDAIMVIKADENSGTMHAVKIAQESKKYVTQFIENKNKQILNEFCNNDIDIENVINFARQQKYELTKNVSYSQESLF